MPTLSPRSYAHLDTCDTRIKCVIERAIKLVPKELDFIVLCGFRGEQEQNLAFNAGNSKLRWPESRHNKNPSLAVDVVPYPIDWTNLDRFYQLATYIFWAAQIEQVNLTWGGHYTKFKDLPHWEIK